MNYKRKQPKNRKAIRYMILTTWCGKKSTKRFYKSRRNWKYDST